MPTGTRPRKSGSANVVWPSPPYVVPSRAKRAWFWLIASNWPLHSAQPCGLKLKPTIMICPMYGVEAVPGISCASVS